MKILWIILLAALVIRSGIYVKRIFIEKPKNYYSEIDGCKLNFDWRVDDKRILYLYRNIGKTCAE